MSSIEVVTPLRDDVVLLRWPEQRAEAQRLDRLGIPHLLLVEPEEPAPALGGCMADWIRLPANDADVRARLTALAARADRHPVSPAMNGTGEMSFRGRRVFLSPMDEQLMQVLVTAFDRGVPESELFDHVWKGDGDPSKVRVHVSRLRKRIRPLGLEITSIRGFGYRLHEASARADGVQRAHADG